MSNKIARSFIIEPIAKLVSGDQLPHVGLFSSWNFAPWNHHASHSSSKIDSTWDCCSSTQSFAIGSIVCSLLMSVIAIATVASAVAPAPTVTAISPASGPTAGGTAVTITGTNFTGTNFTGTNFTGATAVTIGGAAVTGMTVVSATSITATTPAGTAGARNVVVTASGTGTGTGLFTYAVLYPDPTQDLTVRGQIAAQITSIYNFTKAQTSNLSDHLNHLHSNFTDQDGYNNISLNLPSNLKQVMGMTNQLMDAWVAPNSYLVASNSSDLPSITSPEVDEAKVGHGLSSVWLGGTLSYGAIDSDLTNNKFRSSGLTAGMDYFLQDNLIVGAAIGFGWDNVRVDTQGTKTTSISPTFSIYGSYNPMKNTYVDASLGYGTTLLSNKRLQSIDRVLVAGDRRANSYFGLLSISGDFTVLANSIV